MKVVKVVGVPVKQRENVWPFTEREVPASKPLKSGWSVGRASEEAYKAGYSGRVGFRDWLKSKKLDDRSQGQINLLARSYEDGMAKEDQDSRGKRGSGGHSGSGGHAGSGSGALEKEVASALVNYGAGSGEAREAAREAVKGGGSFDAVFKRALDMVRHKQNPEYPIFIGAQSGRARVTSDGKAYTADSDSRGASAAYRDNKGKWHSTHSSGLVPAAVQKALEGGYQNIGSNPLGHGHWESFDSENAAKQYARLMEGQGKSVTRHGKDVRVDEDSSTNPARSGAQYRLAQAVLSGQSDAMPVSVARELVEKTPATLRSAWSKHNPANVEVRDMKLDKEGYDKNGRYWGTGQKVFYYVDDDDNNGYVRATNATEAKSKAIAELSRKGFNSHSNTEGNPLPGVHSDDMDQRLEAIKREGYLYGSKGIKISSSKMLDYAYQLNQKYKVGHLRKASYAFELGYEDGLRAQGSKRNPEPAAADMYESFHGRPSEQIVTFEEDEHYHEYLSELGVCCGLLVEKEDGKCVALGLSGYKWQGKGKDAGFVEGSDTRSNPKRGKKGPILSSWDQANDLVYSGVKGLDQQLGKVLGSNPSSIIGWIIDPKSGQEVWEVHENRDGRIVLENDPYGQPLKDRTYRDLDDMLNHTHGYKFRRVSKRNPGDSVGPNTTLLSSNEDGTQLYLVGGDQSLDLDDLDITGHMATKELITIGDVVKLYYETEKDFDKFEVIQYHHEVGEESGVLPILAYDRLNKRMLFVGGDYHIEKPMFETSPGIEN